MACNNNRDITITYENSSSVAQSIGDVFSLSWGGGETPSVDRSVFGGDASESCPGMNVLGTVTVGVYTDNDNAGQAAIWDAKNNTATTYIRELVITQGANTLDTHTMQAWVSNIGFEAGDKDGQLITNITFQITNTAPIT